MFAHWAFFPEDYGAIIHLSYEAKIGLPTAEVLAAVQDPLGRIIHCLQAGGMSPT